MGIRDWLRRLLGRTMFRQSPASGAHVAKREQPTLDPRVEAAVEAMLRHPRADQSQMLALLENCGFTPPEAWRTYQFLPMAFTHAVFRDRGVEFQTGYVLMDPDTGVRSRHLLADEPLYAAAIMAARSRGAAGRNSHQLLPVFGRSAEYNAIQQLAGPDERLEGVVLTEPLLMTFGG